MDCVSPTQEVPRRQVTPTSTVNDGADHQSDDMKASSAYSKIQQPQQQHYECSEDPDEEWPAFRVVNESLVINPKGCLSLTSIWRYGEDSEDGSPNCLQRTGYGVVREYLKSFKDSNLRLPDPETNIGARIVHNYPHFDNAAQFCGAIVELFRAQTEDCWAMPEETVAKSVLPWYTSDRNAYLLPIQMAESKLVADGQLEVYNKVQELRPTLFMQPLVHKWLCSTDEWLEALRFPITHNTDEALVAAVSAAAFLAIRCSNSGDFWEESAEFDALRQLVQAITDDGTVQQVVYMDGKVKGYEPSEIPNDQEPEQSKLAKHHQKSSSNTFKTVQWFNIVSAVLGMVQKGLVNKLPRSRTRVAICNGHTITTTITEDGFPELVRPYDLMC